MTLRQRLAAAATGVGLAVLVSTPVLVYQAANAATTERVDNEVKPLSDQLANKRICVFSPDCK